MSTIKDQVRQLADSLPDDATFDDLVYRVYVRQKIEAGIQDGEARRVTSQEDVERRFLEA